MAQTLGFIGSGRIGTALARLAVAAGLEVVLSNSRGPETLAELVADLGAHARAATPAEAAQESDLVIATIPLCAYERLPVKELAGRTVVDTMNYYPDRDGNIAELDAGTVTSSELVQRHLAGSQVVKAFNSIDFSRLFTLARPSGARDRSALPIAGGDEAAKTQAGQLLDTLGYDPVDIGTLAESWRSEPGTAVYVKPYHPALPTGMSRDEARRWFYEAPGIPLSAGRVKELTDTAVRARAADARPTLVTK